MAGQAFEPLDIAPDMFLRGLLELARPSLDSPTFRQARAKLEMILFAIAAKPEVRTSATSSSLDGLIAAHVCPTCPSCRGIGCTTCSGTMTTTHKPSDLEWKVSHLTGETQ